MTESILHLDQISRRFGGLTGLHPVSIEVAAGTRHAVIGPNGAGKTTLLNLIAGTLRSSGGSIRFAGRDITRLAPAARARRGIGRTWQHPAVCGRLTVADNLALALTHPADRGGRTILLRRRPGTARLAELADHAGLTSHRATPAGQLPYGLQRQLELAMALAARPALLLLDEPSAGLDPDEVSRLTDLITALPDDVTVMVVDHNLDLIWAIADAVTVLHHGEHLATSTPAEVRADPQVRAAYLSTRDQPATGSQRRTATGSTLLQIHHLRAGYHGAPVLDGVDLDISHGEAVAILGRNGTGKTTLLNTLAGLLPAHAGRIDLADGPHHGPTATELARAGLAIVPQGRRLFAGLTVAEHLTCAAKNRAAPRTTSNTAWTVERILSLLPALAARLNHRADRLSGGEQQMLALARALLTNPRLLLLDEPSEGLAPLIIDHLAATLADLTAAGLTLLIAEQNIAFACAVTDRIVVLHHGRVAMSTRTEQLTQPALRERLHALLGVTGPATQTAAATTAAPAPRIPPP